MKTIVPPVLTGLVLFVAGVFGAAHAFPVLFAMTSAEAWCFLLAGVGLMVSRFHRLRRLRVVMGATVVSAALAAAFSPGAPLLGGMGALSAIGFVLSGAMLALLDRVAQRAASLLAQGGLAAILAIGLVGLCAHMPDLALIYGVSPRAVSMSAPAAAGMIVLAVGLWLACAASDWFWAFYQWREDRQILVLSAMLLLGLTLAAGLGGVMVVSRHSVPLLEKSFQNVLYTDTLLFQNQIEAAVHETASIVSHPALGRFLAKGAAVEGAGAFYEQFVRITETWGMVSVTRFQVMDAAGREVVASGRAEPLAGFRVPLRTPYPAALFWRDGWRVRLRAPVFYDERRVGRVVIEIRLNKLNAVFDHVKQWGASADFNVCAKQRVGLACFLSPGLTEGRRDAFGEGYAAPMRRALAGRQGVMTESGFQGAPVIAAYTPIGDSGLGMVLKIDARDLYQPLRRQLSRALVVFLLLIALGAGFLFLRVRPLVRHLAAAKRYMRAVLDNVPDGIITTDARAAIETVNPGAQTMFGYRADEMIGQAVSRLTPTIFCANGKNSLAASSGSGAVSGTDAEPLEMEGRRRDGSAFLAEVTVGSFHVERHGGSILIVRDVTARKAAETALKESEARLRAITSNVPGMVFQLLRPAAGGPLRFPYVSDGALAVCGLSADVIMADAALFIHLIHTAGRRAFLRSVDASAAAGGLEWEGEFLLPGDGRWLSIRATPRRLAHGDVLWDGIILNMTESRRRQEEVRRSRELLRDLAVHVESTREEERTRIAREIHDVLGQALTALKIEMKMLDVGDAPVVAEKIREMTAFIDHTIEMVRGIVVELRPPVLDLGLTAAIEWQAQTFQERSGIACVADLEESGEAMGNERAAAVFRIVQEALTNVARHAQAGRVEIFLGQEESGWVLEISDDGVGMAEADMRKAQSFGLQGIRERAMILGGEVRVESAPGEGTRVSVRIPPPGGDGAADSRSAAEEAS